MKEVLAGENIAKAFETFGISARKEYQRTPNSTYSVDYQVWSMDEDAFEKLSKFTAEEWSAEDDKEADGIGWWRWAEGSIVESYNVVKTSIKHSEILIYEPDFETRRNFRDLIDYCNCVYGASTVRNLCAIWTSVAKLNNMKLSELLSKCL